MSSADEKVPATAPARTPFPTTIQGKLEYAASCKAEGNEQFKAGNYKKAISKYGKVFAFVRGLPGSKSNASAMPMDMSTVGVPKPKNDGIEGVNENQEIMSSELEATTLLNIATCHTKLGNLEKALEFSDKSIKANAKNWKAHFKRAQTLVAMKFYEKAQGSLTEALSCLYYGKDGEGSDGSGAKMDELTQKHISTVQQQLDIVNIRIKEDKKKEMKSFKGVFDKIDLQEKVEKSKDVDIMDLIGNAGDAGDGIKADDNATPLWGKPTGPSKLV
jgi:tetratricopeptide (TPR) repeat protein